MVVGMGEVVTMLWERVETVWQFCFCATASDASASSNNDSNNANLSWERDYTSNSDDINSNTY